MEKATKNKRMSELLLILWAGGAALLSYSLVYALRKPYTAASFEGLTLFGTDYKVAVTTIQILGYVIAKFFGIKLISELKRENRFRFFVTSAINGRGGFDRLRRAQRSLQCRSNVFQRPFARMHVGPLSLVSLRAARLRICWRAFWA